MKQRRDGLVFRCALGLALAAGATMIGGCSSSSGTGIASPKERRESFPIPFEDWLRLGYRQDWVGYPPVTRGEHIQHVEPYNDIVVVQESGSTISALKVSGGTTLWSNQLADRLSAFVGVNRGGPGNAHVYSASASELFVLDAQTGALIERQRLGKIVTSRPLVLSNDVLVFGTGSNQLMAHMSIGSTQGVHLWGQGIEGAIRTSPVMVGTSIGAVSETGEVILVSAANGALLQSARMLGKGTATNPVSDDQKMYVAGLDQSMWAFSAEEGVVWRVPTPYQIKSQPALVSGRLICTLQDTGLTSFDPVNGKVQWNNKDVRGTPIAVNKNGLLVWDGEQTAWIIDPARGDIVTASIIKGIRTIKADKMDNGVLYVVSESGLVARFVPQN